MSDDTTGPTPPSAPRPGGRRAARAAEDAAAQTPTATGGDFDALLASGARSASRPPVDRPTNRPADDGSTAAQVDSAPAEASDHSELDALFTGGHGAPAIPPAPERSAPRREVRSDFSSKRSRRRSTAVPVENTPSKRGARTRTRRSRRGIIGGIIAVAIFLGLVGTAGVVFYEPVSQLLAGPEETDYEGAGTGEVLFTIHEGDDGSTIANNLVAQDVIKSYGPFYQKLLARTPEPVFQPGAYQMASKMSSGAALAALVDSTTRLDNTFVIPEGTALVDIIPTIADGTGLAVADIEAAAADVGGYGLPAQATSLEGFLFPATYTFLPDTSAHDVLQTLVDRMFTALDEAGVAPDDRYRVVVFASLVQREAGQLTDYPKVARVFQNRLDQGMLLQSDATVAYGTGNTHVVTTTDAERADAGNAYNTYVHPGLPIAPISNPGDVAIDAVLKPAEGTWVFFVTVNLDTGETVFSTTIEEHDAAVAQWQAWMRDHPEYGG